MEKTLVVLAAGMGSRFGGLKQIEPFGPNGEFIIDYSVYDAIKAGFNKVVFVIKKENLDIFKETIGKRIENHIEVEYVFQENNYIEGREKPLGTGQALLCTRDAVKGKFAMINADDYYGKEAFIDASNALDEVNNKTYGLIGYEAVNTITENGAVKRGIVNEKDGLLISLTESSIERSGDVIKATALSDNREFEIALNTPVSMNMLLFDQSIYDYLESDFKNFLDNIKDPLKDEFLLPDVVTKHIENGDVKVKVTPTKAVWYGVTYKEDKDGVVEAINNLIKEGKYNNNLWG